MDPTAASSRSYPSTFDALAHYAIGPDLPIPGCRFLAPTPIKFQLCLSLRSPQHGLRVVLSLVFSCTFIPAFVIPFPHYVMTPI